MPDNKGNIQIGCYPVNDHECFSEILTCLSHALGGLDAFDEHEMNIDVRAKIEAFKLLIFTTFTHGEELEEKLFGGEFSVLQHEKKKELENEIQNS